jgi:hypothetical protein
LRYKIYFTKISRNLDKSVKFTVEFFCPKISPIILVKKATSFVKKITGGPQSNKKGTMSATKKNCKVRFHRKAKRKKRKEQKHSSNLTNQ